MTKGKNFLLSSLQPRITLIHKGIRLKRMKKKWEGDDENGRERDDKSLFMKFKVFLFSFE